MPRSGSSCYQLMSASPECKGCERCSTVQRLRMQVLSAPAHDQQHRARVPVLRGSPHMQTVTAGPHVTDSRRAEITAHRLPLPVRDGVSCVDAEQMDTRLPEPRQPAISAAGGWEFGVNMLFGRPFAFGSAASTSLSTGDEAPPVPPPPSSPRPSKWPAAPLVRISSHCMQRALTSLCST